MGVKNALALQLNVFLISANVQVVLSTIAFPPLAQLSIFSKVNDVLLAL